MKGAERGLARRYAQALLDLASERGQLDAVREPLQAAAEALAAGSELAAALANPALPGERKQAIVRALWPVQDGAGGLVARLVALLAERGRARLLPAVHEAFVVLWNAHNDVVGARVLSATLLDEAQLRALRQALGQVTGRAVELRTDIDAQLQGGLVLELEGRVYDGSVRTRLRALRERLLADGGRA